jgi:threonine dehydrogenase-like Zn-dependent dehydrogenase
VQTRQFLGLRANEPQEDLADKVFGHTTAGLFGYTHLTGGYPGGQAEYLRVPFADKTHIKVPDSLTGRAGALPRRHLPDRLAGGRAVRHRADRHGGDLGLRPGRSDGDPQRHAARRQAGGRHRLHPGASRNGGGWRRHHHQLREESVIERLNELTGGKGPEKCIDAVGLESHVSPGQPDTVYDRAKQATMLENDRPHVLREMIYVCRPAGIISIPGVYGGLVDKIPMGGDEQGPDLPHGPDACEPLDRRSAAPHRGGQIDPSFVITHTVGLEEGPEMYKVFRDKQDSCIKVVLKP